MKPSVRPVRSALALALALAAMPAFAQATYTQTVFFGDSLTDAGFFRPLLPPSVQLVTGQFTTNPGLVWSQNLAEHYGTTAGASGNGQTGTNYAAGGARVGINTTGALGPIPSLATQTSNYLAANGGRADSGALYTVWGGANDLFAITNAGAPATATITAAVTAQVGIVGQLQSAGARYILVPTIPDLGSTPAFRAQGAAAQASGTALTVAYNNALFSGLTGSNLRVIPIDTFSFIREIIAAPAEYGFTNITGTACQPQITANSLTCNPSSWVTPDAPNTYLFADGVHPTTRAHLILSEYVISVLEAPRQIALLSNSSAVIGRARAERVATHVDGKPEADGMRWWGGLRGDSQRYDDGELYDGITPAGTFGVDWSRGAVVFGGFGGYGSGTQDFGRNSGSFKQSDATLGGFVGWYGEQAWVSGQLSYTWLSFDVDREVHLGGTTRTHSGSPDGSNLSVGISGGYEFGEGAFRHGPVLSLLSQQITVDGYAESNPSSSALAYADQDFDSLIGSAGWQVSYAVSEHVRPYARLTYDREFEESAEEVFASVQSLPGVAPYAVPGLDLDDSYSTLLLGARSQVFGLDADFGLSTTIGQKSARDVTAFATLSGSF